MVSLSDNAIEKHISPPQRFAALKKKGSFEPRQVRNVHNIDDVSSYVKNIYTNNNNTNTPTARTS